MTTTATTPCLRPLLPSGLTSRCSFGLLTPATLRASRARTRLSRARCPLIPPDTPRRYAHVPLLSSLHSSAHALHRQIHPIPSSPDLLSPPLSYILSYAIPASPPLSSPLLSLSHPPLSFPRPDQCPIFSSLLSYPIPLPLLLPLHTTLHTNPCISTPSPSPPAAHQQAPRRPPRRPRRRRGPLPRTTVVAGSVTSAALAALAALARPSAAVGCSALPLPSARIHTLSSFRSLPYPPSVSPPSYSLP